MTAAEGKALLDFLLEHGHRPEFTFRFRWQKGSIAFWDNRSTKHIALGDTGPFRRLMRRVQIGGGVPADLASISGAPAALSRATVPCSRNPSRRLDTSDADSIRV